MENKNQLTGLKTFNRQVNREIRQLLQATLLNLMSKKDYHKITITELCQAAHVSRMSFYTNFGTKDKLLETIVIEQNQQLISQIGSPFRDNVDQNWYRHLFTAVHSFAGTLKLFFDAGFKYKYISIINDLVLYDQTINTTVRYARLMWAGGITNAAIDWIEHGLTTPVDEIAEDCFRSCNIQLTIR